MAKVVAFVASPDRPSKTCSICREAIDWIADAHVVFLPCKKTIPLLEWGTLLFVLNTFERTDLPPTL